MIAISKYSHSKSEGFLRAIGAIFRAEGITDEMLGASQEIPEAIKGLEAAIHGDTHLLESVQFLIQDCEQASRREFKYGQELLGLLQAYSEVLRTAEKLYEKRAYARVISELVNAKEIHKLIVEKTRELSNEVKLYR